MTEQQVLTLLLRSRYSRNFCLPNYTPKGWFECDLFELTPAGYVNEYEIKLTVSDFKADALKQTERRRGPWVDGLWTWIEGQNKHQMLQSSHVDGPSRFIYVCPENMVKEVPAWAGLIEIVQTEHGMRERPKIAPPLLHRQKVKPEVESHARGVCYWRFHNLRMKQK